jgi:pimeloyl-ACP methyl ester carboxylesterase
MRTTRFRCLTAIGLIFFSASTGSARQAMQTPAPAEAAATAAQDALVSRARDLGAADVIAKPAPDGGATISGKLSGVPFAIAFPTGWKGDGMLYSHGYSAPGTPAAVEADPVAKGPGGGLFRAVYGQGVAVGHSAYDKAGLGVETAVRNTKRLRDFLTALGGKRIYVVGDSMGGSIVVTLLELYPSAFAGGLARCGVVSSWKTLLGQLTDMRLAYNALTRGTPFVLPGEQDVRVSAISSVPPAGTADAAATAYVWGRMGQVAQPPLALWTAAQKNPDGPEARIARYVTAIGGFDYDAAALAYPLVTTALGASDMVATAGGWIYDNRKKHYTVPGMTAQEEATLNGQIQRVRAAPRAIAYLTKWHEATGRISTPLLTMHNRIDSLVPYAQETAFEAKVRRNGRERFLAAYAVPPTRAPLPIGGIEGYTHCGFTLGQTMAAWNALREWVETGRKPDPDAIR